MSTTPQDPPLPDAERAATRQGLVLLAWVLLWLSLAGAFANRAGLKYAEIAGWPTDIYAFVHGSAAEPGARVDIAILGSSKASFGLPADLIATCAERRGGAPVRVVNLARMYGTAWTVWTLVRDLFATQPPRMLLIGLEPELFDDHNPRMIESFPTTAELEDLPDLVGVVLGPHGGWRAGVALVRSLTRGAEHSAAYLLGATLDARLRWFMQAYGGGQWCFEDACRGPVRERWRSDYRMWDHRLQTEIPTMGEDRFGEASIGDGINGRALERLLDWAETNEVMVVGTRVPLHSTFQAQVPAELESAYVARIAALQARGLRVWDPDVSGYANARELFLDPEHLNPTGAQRFANEVCSELVGPAWAERSGR